jgi:hypothetical protein
MVLKLFDKVRLVTDKYSSEGASKGEIGDIVEIYRGGGSNVGYHVAFTNPVTGDDYALIIVRVEDVEKIDI